MFYGDDELQRTILGLQFRVSAKHFKDGDMKLKCLASISTIYWKTNEESVKGDKPLIKVMSSQDTSLPNKSRADRVQGKTSPNFQFILFHCDDVTPKIISFFLEEEEEDKRNFFNGVFKSFLRLASEKN